MPTITFIHPNGQHERVDASDGESAMLAATRHGLDGIVAECGGNAMCATCHVYVDEGWIAPCRRWATRRMRCSMARLLNGCSRLSCQIKLRPELDGLVMRLPERQI